jgi:ribonuclease VapC
MVIDTSAVMAILFGEPDARQFALAIEAVPLRLISSGTALESAIVIERAKGDAGQIDLERFFHRVKIEIVPFTLDQFEIAKFAYSMFGRRRSPAGLNFGDCFSYALSKSTGYPLLFKGEDFRRTDVVAAL